MLTYTFFETRLVAWRFPLVQAQGFLNNLLVRIQIFSNQRGTPEKREKEI